MSLDADFWGKQLRRANDAEEKWRETARNLEKKYADERTSDTGFKFNLFWANVETQRPALYSNTPRPDTRRRFYGDDLPNSDPVGKEASKLVDRSISFAVDPGNGRNFDSMAQSLISDFLIVGRTLPVVKYVPTFARSEKRIDLKEDEEGNVFKGLEKTDKYERDENGPYVKEYEEEVIWEECIAERVPWRYFRMEPECTWSDVSWVAFGKLYSKSQIQEIDGYKKHVDELPYDFNADGEYEPSKGAYCLIWCFWYKPNRTVYHYVEGFDEILEEEEDPLKLAGFFPCPEPAYAVPRADTLVPKPEFALYEDQAEEIDRITERIASIATMIKATGLYAGEEKDLLQQLRDAKDGELVPVENWRGVTDKGGVAKLVEWWPIADIVAVFQTLIRERADLIAQVYELTGISDIQRGDTDPRETKGAQVIKANFATRRLLPKQQNIQRMFRDTYRLMAEVMVEHFDPKRLQDMTGVQMTADLLLLLKTDGLRAFRVDIETDSTIAPDDARDKEGVAEFVSALSKLASAMAPIAQLSPGGVPMIGQILLWAMKRFRVSRDVETQLQAIIAAPPPQKKDPEMVKAEAQIKVKEAELKMEAQKMQMELQKMMMEMQLEQRKFQEEMKMKMVEFQQNLAISRVEAQSNIQNRQLESQAKAQASVIQAQRGGQKDAA